MLHAFQSEFKLISFGNIYCILLVYSVFILHLTPISAFFHFPGNIHCACVYDRDVRYTAPLPIMLYIYKTTPHEAFRIHLHLFHLVAPIF